jgi:hypothetical protein
MQATQDVTQNAQPSPDLDTRASSLPEYVYRAAILVAVVILLWTVA